jgi:hypothetical protein
MYFSKSILRRNRRSKYQLSLLARLKKIFKSIFSIEDCFLQWLDRTKYINGFINFVLLIEVFLEYM